MEFANNRRAIEERQRDKVNAMLQALLPANEFYRKKFSANDLIEIRSLDDLKRLPFTTKSELVEDQLQHPPFGTDLTFPQEHYIRIHQTSGTTGKPMYWLDTEESWDWWAECWKVIFAAAGVHPGDRIFFAFSFGPFIGFWAGWEGARKLGAMAVSGGGQSTSQRLKTIIDYRRDRPRLHANVRAAHGVGGAKSRHGSRQRVRHKNNRPCGRTRGEYSEHKKDD